MNLERAANWTIILAALSVTGLYANRWYTSATAGPTKTVTHYSIGEVMPELPTHSFASAERSIVVFLHSQCRYCSDSMPFYRALLKHRSEQRAVPVIAVSREPERQLRDYLAHHNVVFDRVVSIGGDQKYKLHATPTLLVLDGHGAVKHVRVGLIPEDASADTLALVAPASE
jgi:hypothetical protein